MDSPGHISYFMLLYFIFYLYSISFSFRAVADDDDAAVAAIFGLFAVMKEFAKTAISSQQST